GDVVDYMGVNNGTVVNALQTDAGKFGKGFTFDGAGDYVVISDSNSLKPSNITISAWIKPLSNTTANMAIYTTGTTIFQLTQADIRFWPNTGVGVVSSTDFNYPTDEWMHVVVTFENGTQVMRYYRDGLLLDDTLAGSNITYGTSQWIGSWSSAQRPFNGTIDEVMIFNRSLSADEVAALYNITSDNQTDFNYTADLSDGAHTFKVYAVDEGANVNSTAERTVTLDSTNPTVSYVSPTPENASGMAVNSLYVNVSVTETNENNVTFRLYNGSNVLESSVSYPPVVPYGYNLLNNSYGTFEGIQATSELGGGDVANQMNDNHLYGGSAEVWMSTNRVTTNQ
ncbi:MAG: LamG domain-containing protein, partial [Anaerolineales bacterium]|nr:LamG domain-containing protein [Anaerolineales bacterium]